MWNKDKDIFALMVGHGKSLNGTWDSGCVYGKYTEAELMLPIVKVAAEELRRNGIRVITDSDANNNRNMIACVKWANSTPGVKYYMSIHVDYKGATPGIAPLYVSSAGKQMATTVGKIVAKEMEMKWKGAFKRTNLYELNATTMPAVIFETGAIYELKYIQKSKEYGMALADGILKFLGVEKKPKVKHSTAWYLRKKAKKIAAYMAEHNFKYKASWKDNAMTWAGAKKKKTTNCSDFVSYSLQQMKAIPKGGIFWINGESITCKGNMTLADLKKVATISHPNHSPKHAHLHKGDICGYGGKDQNAHTMIFAGFNKKGQPTWYSTGSTTEIQKGKAHVKKTYTNKIIKTIIRLK